MTVPTHLDPWGQGIYALPPAAYAETDSVPSSAPPSARQGEPGSRPASRFTSLEQFVNGYLAQIICRRLGHGTAVWCPEWWRHPEAVIRFEALRQAFESLVKDTDVGVSNWWIYHADPHLRALLDPDWGPFSLCDPEDGHAQYPPRPLPVRTAPSGFDRNPLFRMSDAEFPGE